jgi:predicted ATP-grasp superfamily ATP-dependent carboligase
MSTSRPVLIVAVTGRAIAASAARGGFPVVVLDYFADRDTVAVAHEARAVVAAGAWRFDRRALLRLAAELVRPGASAGLVYGAGFEGAPELLARLAADRVLLGNPPEVVARVRDPAQIFPLFDRLGISHPEVRSTPPEDPAGWLVKRAGGAGGAHIRPATRRWIPRDGYFQRHTAGVPHSVLFLADGRRGCIVGVNRQWTADARPDRPFLYGGAVGGVLLPPSLAAALPAQLDQLIAATGLVGLNGLDFLVEDERWSALEVNPRPTATLDLYDEDVPAGLFALHVEACHGLLPAALPHGDRHRAHAVVHASIPFEVSAEFSFPVGCRDIPVPGSRFSVGDPLCSIHAEGASIAGALTQLAERRRSLETALRSHTVPSLA